jgi:hypothetical protein
MEKAPSESQSRILSLPSITINPVPKMDIKSADMVQKGDSSLQLDVNNIKMKVRQ